jgi:hypothetical protein
MDFDRVCPPMERCSGRLAMTWSNRQNPVLIASMDCEKLVLVNGRAFTHCGRLSASTVGLGQDLYIIGSFESQSSSETLYLYI